MLHSKIILLPVILKNIRNSLKIPWERVKEIINLGTSRTIAVQASQKKFNAPLRSEISS